MEETTKMIKLELIINKFINNEFDDINNSLFLLKNKDKKDKIIDYIKKNVIYIKFINYKFFNYDDDDEFLLDLELLNSTIFKNKFHFKY
jgi:hypothetical protein